VIFPPIKKETRVLATRKKTKQKQINPGPNSVDSNLDEVETLNNVKMSLHF
jgi:hypothetical protein